MNGRRLNIELTCIFLEGRDIFISNGFRSRTFGNRCLDNFVIDVSKVADIINLITSILEVTADGVKGYRATGVADMDIVIDSRTADIESYLPLFNNPKNICFVEYKPLSLNLLIVNRNSVVNLNNVINSFHLFGYI